MMNATPLALFAVFAGLSMNLILQFGLGLREIAITTDTDKKKALIQMGGMFIMILVMWMFFSYLIAALPLGFFITLLVFPLTSLGCCGAESLLRRFAANYVPDKPSGFYTALVGAALFITLHIAGGFLEALILDVGFILGILLTFIIVSEIRRRSFMEEAPHFLRGTPLILISMGLLSMVFSFSALMLLRSLRGQ